MKRLTAVWMTLALLLGLAACGAKPADTAPAAPQTTADVTKSEASETAAEETSAAMQSLSETATEPTLTGWKFDEETGTLYLYEQQFLDKTPYTGDPKIVKAVELGGSVHHVRLLLQAPGFRGYRRPCKNPRDRKGPG